MLEKWCFDLGSVLNQRFAASQHEIEKRHLRLAMSSLSHHQPSMTKSFTSALTKAMAKGMRQADDEDGNSLSSFGENTGFDELTLMGDQEVQERVDRTRLHQTVAMASDAGLAAFYARLSTAQGFSEVKAENNPLRPEVFSGALLKAVQSVPVDSVVRSHWLTYGSPLLGQQMQALYMALNDLLIDRGVTPAAYRVISTQDAKITNRVDASRSGFGRLDASRGDQNGQTESISGYDPMSSAFGSLEDDPGELPTITFPKQSGRRPEPSRVALPAAPASALAPANASANAMANGSVNARPRAETQTLSQSPAGKAVNLLLEKITSDPRLLARVRQVVSHTKPVFHQLAIHDPRFLKDATHPARLLLANIVSSSLAFPTEEAVGFAEFFQDLKDIAIALAGSGTATAEHFAAVLASFKATLKQRQAIAHDQLSRTPQAMAHGHQRNMLAKQIAEEILARTDLNLGNPAIVDFLTGLWSQVLAAERLAVNADKTGMYKAIFSLTLGELLWSLDASQTAPHPKRLAKLIPSVIERLRAGLLSIDSPPADSQAFFDEITALHQQSLNAAPDAGGQMSADHGTAPLHSATPLQPGQVKANLDSAFGAGDAAYSEASAPAPLTAKPARGKKDVAVRLEQRFQPTQPFVDTQANEKPKPDDQTVQLGGVELRLGAWVDMTVDEQWVRAQLTWISLYKTLFLFTSAGGRTHSVPEPLLQFLLLQGMVKVVSPDGVLPQP